MRPSQLSCTTATFGGKLPEKLRAMQSAGFAATEFWPRDLFENAEGPDVAIDLLRRTGLAVSAYQALRNFEGLTAQLRGRKLGIAEQLMDQMALVGCDLLVLCSNTDPDSNGDPERIAGDLRLLGDLARSRNVRIAYEALSWGRWIRDYRDAWQVIKAVDHQHIGMMLDSFHIFALGLPLDGIDAISADKVFLVEIADLPGTNLEPIEISRHYRLFPGEGVGPIDEFLRRVRGIGYTGCLSVEIFNAHYSASVPGEVAARAMRATTGALNRVERH
jgi:4-hydroxyphenylpyruvate dioxygenase